MPQHFTYSQMAALKRRHIIIRVERQDKVVLCWDHGRERYYTFEDLIAIAQPSIGERLMGLIGRAA